MWGLLLASLARLAPFAVVLGQGLLGYLVGPLFNSIKNHWRIWLIGLFFTTTVVTSKLWQDALADLVSERAAHARDIKSYKDAKEEAEDKIEETRAELTKKAKVDAAQADKLYDSLNARYRASLLRYKALESVRSGAGGNLPGGSTQGGNRSDPDTQFSGSITIPTNDAYICAVNTARLQAAQEWATSLSGVKP